MSFNKLDKDELVRTAEEDFAVDVDRSWPKSKVIKALEDSGVDFAMYLAQNPDKAEVSDVPANVRQEPLQPPAKVNTPEEPMILIKMLRENPLYEVAGYRWTAKHPYALVKEKDADRILIREEGFRQATPSELQEYYA